MALRDMKGLMVMRGSMADMEIAYKLIRSRRRTVSIRITGAGGVEVRAPLTMAADEIERFVRSKGAWIESHLEKTTRKLEKRAAFSLDYGASVPLLGKSYMIEARAGNNIGYDDRCVFLPPGLAADEIKQAVILLYRHVAKGYIQDRIREFAPIMGVSPAAIKINGAKTRWGSCSGKNSVNFSWRLIVAPRELVDYVVVHELAHIKAHDHSPRFWAQVEQVLPDYKTLRRRLKGVHEMLDAQDWG
jgi:predicted metal-dependent hydrolase